MANYTSGNTAIKNRAKTKGINSGEQLAGDFLAEKCYERREKPREVNGGRDRFPKDYAQQNKAKLNRSLASKPTQMTAQAPTAALRARKKRFAPQIIRVAEVRKQKAATPFPIFAILCLLALTVISLYVIHLYIELDEMDSMINQYNNQIAEMKKEERELKSRKAGMYDLGEIERIAKEEYGMVDADQLPKEYITPDAQDSIEIMENSLEDETPDVLLSGFAGVVSELLSYIN